MTRKISETYRAAEEFARRVIAALDGAVDSMVLNGSVARGEARRDSDIDVLVVSQQPEVIRKRVSAICGDFAYERGYTFFISTICYSREELMRLVELRSPFLANVVGEGKILYDNGAFAGVREQAITVGQRGSG
jgi:predicted nucleotidyltransferase